MQHQESADAGSCIPEGIVNTRSTPRSPVISRGAVPNSSTRPMTQAPADTPQPRIRCRASSSCSRGENSQITSLTGHLKRVQPQQPARRPDILTHGNGHFIQLHCQAGRFRNLRKSGGQPAAGHVTQAMHGNAGTNDGATDSCNGAESLSRPSPKDNPVRRLIIVMPCLPKSPLSSTESPDERKKG